MHRPGRRHNLWAIAAALLAVAFASPAAADQVILKDGRVVEGDAVRTDLTRKVVVVTRGKSTFEFPLSKVLRVVGKDGDDKDPQKVVEVVVIPLQGEIKHLRASEELRRLVNQAVRLKPKAIVFEISSPGGRVDVARELAKTILSIKKVRTVAYVSGSNRGAYSAAAYLALCCQRIYMAPGQSIGAAVAYRAGNDGTPRAVSEKFSSAWRADFRAVAEANGYPVAVALAMVDSRVGAVEVRYGGKRRFAAARDLRSLERRARSEGVAFERVRTLCRAGRVLTLTSKEAVRARLARSVKKDLNAILIRHKVDPTRVKRLPDPLLSAARAVKKSQKELDRGVKALTAIYTKLQAQNPRKHVYMIKPRSRAFLDGGKMWRKRTAECLASVRKGLKKLAAIQKMGQKNPDLEVDAKVIARIQTDLRSFATKLKAEKKLKHLPLK